MSVKTKSATEKFLECRSDGNASDIKPGAWYSGFTKVKKFAETNKMPFVGVWSNGDSCSHCVALEKCFMTKAFKDWMAASGCVFWFGCELDKSKDDKAYGKGFKWAWDNESISVYPFFRFYWTDGKNSVGKSESGDWWRDWKSGAAGAKKVIARLAKLIDKTRSFGPEDAKLKVRTNPDWTDEQVKEFKQKVKDNDGYCPCVPKRTADSKCMCKWFREKAEEGLCHCELYQKYR